MVREQSAELARGDKGAIAGERIATGKIPRSRDMTGNGIDRLNVTAEAFWCARVEQCHVGCARLLRRQRRERAGVQIIV
jgi:hypothetical protein